MMPAGSGSGMSRGGIELGSGGPQAQELVCRIVRASWGVVAVELIGDYVVVAAPVCLSRGSCGRGCGVVWDG